MSAKDQIHQNDGDDLSELDGLFSKSKEPEEDPKPEKTEKEPEAKKPKAKSKAKGGAKKKKPKKPKSESFFEGDGDNEVAIASRMVEVKKIINGTKCKGALDDLLSSINNLDEEDPNRRNVKIGENFANMIDRLQAFIRFNFNLKTRDVTNRILVESLLLAVMKDLQENGKEAQIIQMVLERKLASQAKQD